MSQSDSHGFLVEILGDLVQDMHVTIKAVAEHLASTDLSHADALKAQDELAAHVDKLAEHMGVKVDEIGLEMTSQDQKLRADVLK